MKTNISRNDSKAIKKGGQSSRVTLIQSLYPEFWFRAGEMIETLDRGLSKWGDYSGRGHHLTQATDANRLAVLNDGTVAGDGGVRWAKMNAFTFAQPCTVYGLLRMLTFSPGGRLWDGDAYAGGTLNMTGALHALGAYAGGVEVAEAGAGLMDVGLWAAVGVVYNGANSSIRIGPAAALVASGNVGASAMGGFTLACAGNQTLFAHAQFAELIGCSGAHDALTMSKVMIDHLTRMI
jgi:hypothetical protein